MPSPAGRARARCRHAQTGAALVTALVVLVALLIIGVSAAHTALNAEKATRAERDRHIALQCAQAALEDAERDIEGGSDPASARAALFASANAQGFEEGCGNARQANGGLCALAAPSAVPAWQGTDLTLADTDATSTQYGAYTGATMPVGRGSLPARLPRYIIELMPYAAAGGDASERTGNFYRITAIGFGSSERTRVVLQTFYLKAAPGEEAS